MHVGLLVVVGLTGRTPTVALKRCDQIAVKAVKAATVREGLVRG